MASRSHSHTKAASEFTPASTQNVIQTRPFAPPAKSDVTPTLTDIEAQLDHAQRFGHHLANFATSEHQSAPPIIQPKLTIGAPGDKYEQEADRVAAQVVQQLHSPQMDSPQNQQSIQREAAPEEDKLQMRPWAERIQPGAILKEDSFIYRQIDNSDSFEASDHLESRIKGNQSGGQPLDSTILSFMEPRFQHSFSKIRVHTDREAVQMNQELHAQAFTNGNHIYFNSGKYTPSSNSGKELLAHELTHTIQQTGGSQLQRHGETNFYDADHQLGSALESCKISVSQHVGKESHPLSYRLTDSVQQQVSQIQRNKDTNTHSTGCSCATCGTSVQRKSDGKHGANCPCSGCISRDGQIQAKLTVGAPRDPYEQEADRVAAQVMRMPEASHYHRENELTRTKPSRGLISPTVHSHHGLDVNQEQASLQRKVLDNSGQPIKSVMSAKTQLKQAITKEWSSEPNFDLDTIFSAIDTNVYTDGTPRTIFEILTTLSTQLSLPSPHPPAQTPSVVASTTVPITQPKPPVVTPGDTLYAALDPADLDAGKHFLKRLRDARPKGLNDATHVGSKSNMSNCALATIGAIVNKSASEATVDVQQKLGGRLPLKADKKLQKETMWATQLLPASMDPLKAAGIIETIDVPGFSEGKAEIIGNAQFYGMMKYLMTVFQLPPSSTPSSVTGGSPSTSGQTPGDPTGYKLYQHGEPSATGDKQSTLLSTMKGYPSGTRFAVFVYSSDLTQHTRAHWVYAELFGSTVVFGDYQKNEFRSSTKSDPVVEVLDAFPPSPDKGDIKAKKGFESGSFIAIVPIFGGVDPTGIGDPEIGMDRIDGILAEAQARLLTLVESRQVDGPTSGSFAPGTLSKTPSNISVEIPSPTLVKTEVEQFISNVGQTPQPTLGANPAEWVIQVVGHPQLSFRDGMAKIEMMSLNNYTQAVDEQGSPTQETVKGAAGGSKAYAEDFRTGLGFIGSTSALAGDRRIYVNPTLFHFPDLIHEVFHTYSAQSTADKPFNEGCTEIFASMVSEKIRARSNNVKYVYEFNIDYLPYVSRMQQLISLIGLDKVANAYFDGVGPAKSLAEVIKTRGFDTNASDNLASQLTAGSVFPNGFDAAIKELARGPSTTSGGASSPVASTTRPAWADDYDRHKIAFSKEIEKQRHLQEATGEIQYLTLPDEGLTPEQTNSIADAASKAERIAFTEKELRRYYPKLSEAIGAAYIALASYISDLEGGLAALKGISPEEVHNEFAKSVVITFEFDDLRHEVRTDQSVYLFGKAPELGKNDETRAIPLIRVGGKYRSAPIEFINPKQRFLEMQFLLKRSGTVIKRYGFQNPPLPKGRTATVTGQIQQNGSVIVSSS